MFKHVSVPIIEDLQPKMKKVKVGDKKIYVIDGEEKDYPALTKILGEINKEWIYAWRARVGEEVANRIARQACVKGNTIHHLLEDLFHDRKIVLKDYPLHIQVAFKAMREILVGRLTEVYLQEAMMYSDFLRIVGKVDCVGVFDGKLSIIDFKTSRREKTAEDIENYFLQMTAYAIMYEELTGTPITQLVVVMAVDGDTRGRVFIENRDKWAKKLMRVIANYHINN